MTTLTFPKDASPASKTLLDSFRLDRILDQDPKQKSANLLGSLQLDGGKGLRQQAILILEKTHFTEASFDRIGQSASSSSVQQTSDRIGEPPIKTAKLSSPDDDERGDGRRTLFEAVQDLGQNDIYTWLLAWLSPFNPSAGTGTGTEVQRDADVKLTLICPATSTHVEKYSAQSKAMVYETPEMYRDLVRPYIEAQPPSRIQWVYNILDHEKEADTILYEDPDRNRGFIIVPDLKWDQKTSSSLYLQAIVHDRSLRSLRDLKREHVGMLKEIRKRAAQVASEKYGLKGKGGSDGIVRCFIHYQPSYYHLHVHILAASLTSHPGAIVGQAHLLEDVIDLLELGVDFQLRTLGYALGDNSQLWNVLRPPRPLPASEGGPTV